MVIAALALGAIAQPAHAQDVAAGEQSFKKCSPCHSIGEGAKNKVGPELDGYNYSEANMRFGIVWNEQTFKEYIKNPRAKIPGTKMTLAGITNEKESGNLWAYLTQFDPDGKKK